MFQKNLILRHFQHFYVIQTILELQRQCNVWYSRLKHKFVFLLQQKRSQLKGAMNKSRYLLTHYNNRQQKHQHHQHHSLNYYNDYCADSVIDYDVDDGGGGVELNSGNNRNNPDICGQFLTDLNQMLVNGSNKSSSSPFVSIPIQMLLLPFIAVQQQQQQQSTATTANKFQQVIAQSQAEATSFQRHKTPTHQLTSTVSDYQSFVLGEQARGLRAINNNQPHNNNQITSQQFASSPSFANWFSSHHQQQQQQANLPLKRGSRSCGLTLRNPLVCSTLQSSGGHIWAFYLNRTHKEEKQHFLALIALFITTQNAKNIYLAETIVR